MTVTAHFDKKSDQVQIHLGDEQTITGPRCATVEELLSVLENYKNLNIMGAFVNDELRELTFPVEMESRVAPVTIDHPDGTRIYRRSVTFLIEAAFEELFPNDSLIVDHSLSSGGFYCEVEGRPPLSKKELTALESKMREWVTKDAPLLRLRVPIAEAIEYFEGKGQLDKVELLKYRRKPYLILYQLGEHRDYHHGYMVPSTGYLKWFDLQQLGTGFALRIPRRSKPGVLQRLPESEKLLLTYQQYGDWLNKLGINNVAQLNKTIENGRIDEVVLVSEALHEQRIVSIASKIRDDARKPRIVLIAGPSSSGKTTFSKRLSLQLLTHGIEPYAIELDNYFVNREDTPKDADGVYDFEAIGAINVHLLSEQINRLINGEEIQMPRYNFVTGLSEPGDTLKIRADQLLILEGIHALNPELLPGVDEANVYRIYASCLTQLNLDRYNRISTTDSRLIRRIIRDSRERGYNAMDTISRWGSVNRGEERYIFPFQEKADEFFNSALAYEVSACKALVEPLLRQVPYGSEEYSEAKRLLAFTEWFVPMDTSVIPDNSILREFIGGSILKEFKGW